MNMVCNNMYPKFVELPEGPIPRLEHTPGLQALVTTSTDQGECRALTAVSGEIYQVVGNSFYEVDESGNILNSFSGITGTGQGSIADNGDQIMFIDPVLGNGYIYTRSLGTFAEITAAGFKANGQPAYVIFIDGYFMVSTRSNNYIISGLRDGFSWNALDVGTAEADPDVIIGLTSFKNEAYIFGKQTCEGVSNVPSGSGFPFLRNGLYLDKGLEAPLSIVHSTDTFMWIGSGQNEQPAIYALSGTSAVRISNTAIELLLSNLTAEEKSQIRGSSYMQDGSFFLVWSLPSVAILYDITTQRWHTRTSRIEENDITWRVRNIAETDNGTVVVGDSQDGTIGVLDRDVYTEYEASNIVRTHDARPIRIGKQSFSMPLLELTIESGVGVSVPPAGDAYQSSSDPVVSMAISRDAQTFQNNRSRSMGLIGQRNKRLRWRRNGVCPDYVQFRFTMSDAVPYTVVRLDAQVVTGRG